MMVEEKLEIADIQRAAIVKVAELFARKLFLLNSPRACLKTR